MAQIKELVDKNGIIFKANKILPEKFHSSFIQALAELEDNECHKKRTFPKTRLHKVEGVKEKVYRADIDKISGWRIHLQYKDGQLYLNDILADSEHDRVIKVIKTKKGRYE